MTRWTEGLTRRTMLAGGVAIGAVGALGLSRAPAFAQQGPPLNCAPINPPATAIPFTPNAALPIRMRKSAFDLSPTEAARLKAAFAALRKLSQDDPLDPRGWLNQAHVHCWYCGGPQGDGTGAGAEIHGSWNFMPWHRAYLYFLERILATLIEDDTFALPYWDWNTVRMSGSGPITLPHAALPLPYINPNARSNPLHDELRLVGASERLPASFVGPTMMNPIMQNTNSELFFGSPPDSPNPVSGMVEFGPHGIVHLWVGDPLMRDPVGTSDMGVLATAAQDPIFFAHHGNIDRIWDLWLAQGGGRANPSDAAWGDTTWTFFDENSNWIAIKASDVVDRETALRYNYQPPAGSVSPVADAAPAAAAPATTSTPSVAAVAALALAAPEENLELGPEPLTRSVALPEPHRSALMSASPQDATVPVIRISDIQAPIGGAAIVRVFANLPDANSTTPVTDPHYVGYFTLVPNSLRGAHTHGQAGLNVELPLSPETQQVVAGGQDLSITLVPVTGDESAPLNLSLTIGGISLTSR